MNEPLPRVVVGNPQTIAHGLGLNAGPQMLRLASGDLVVPVDRYEGSAIAESFAMISSDAGESWRKVTIPWSPSVTGRLGDGTILGLAVRSDGPPKEPGVYTYRALRGRDTWESLRQETVTFRVPAITGIGDDLAPYHGMIPWNTLVEMPDGSLLMTAYGYFEGDDVPIEISYQPYRPKSYPHPGFNKTRSVLLRSADRGRSWGYVSTVAYDPSSGEAGPCEPSLARSKDGDLVCMVRTGRVNALRMCRSSDGGGTWSPLEIVPGTIGVAPFLITMQDGTLVCVYGMKEDYWRQEHRRELRVILSFDGGRTWPLNEILYAGDASSYASLCEATPGELIACFTSPGLPMPDAEQRAFVCVVPIRLKPPPVYKWP